jgi:hypothetical protein
MSEDKTEYFFDFTLPFSIHDDNEILKRMGLANPPTTPLSGSSLPVNSNTNPISEGGVTMNSTSNSNSITSDNNQHNTNMNMNAMNTNPNVPISTPGKIHKHIVINPSSSPLCQGINGVAPSPQQPSPQPLFSALSQPQTPLKSVQSTQLQMNNTPQPIVRSHSLKCFFLLHRGTLYIEILITIHTDDFDLGFVVVVVVRKSTSNTSTRAAILHFSGSRGSAIQQQYEKYQQQRLASQPRGPPL